MRSGLNTAQTLGYGMDATQKEIKTHCRDLVRSTMYLKQIDQLEGHCNGYTAGKMIRVMIMERESVCIEIINKFDSKF